MTYKQQSEPITKPVLLGALTGLSTPSKTPPAETAIAVALTEVLDEPTPVVSLPEASTLADLDSEMAWSAKVYAKFFGDPNKPATPTVSTPPAEPVVAIAPAVAPANETEAQWSKRINREWQEREKARIAEAAKMPVIELRPLSPPELPAETLEEFKSKLADHRHVNPNVRIVR